MQPSNFNFVNKVKPPVKHLPVLVFFAKCAQLAFPTSITLTMHSYSCTGLTLDSAAKASDVPVK